MIRERTYFWNPAIDDVLTRDSFLGGVGFGENLSERYGLVDLHNKGANPLRNVHNSHLNVLTRMGVVGLAFWLGLWGIWFYHLFRARTRLRMVDSPRSAAFLGWAMLAVTAMLTNTFLDGTLEGPRVAVWLWAIFGLGTAIAMETNLREWRRRRAGADDIARGGGETNPLELSLRQLKKASKQARGR